MTPVPERRRSKILLYATAVAAIAGLVLSVLSYVAAFRNGPGPLGDHAWILHFGALAVLIPAVLAARRLQAGCDRNQRWNAVLRGCPVWMKYALYLVLGYAMVNFTVFLFAPSKTPAAAVRGFAGHWMACYAAALTILYSDVKVSRSLTTQPLDHPL